MSANSSAGDAQAVRALLSECEAGLNATEKQLKSADLVMRSYKLQLTSARDNMANVKLDIQVRVGAGDVLPRLFVCRLFVQGRYITVTYRVTG